MNERSGATTEATTQEAPRPVKTQIKTTTSQTHRQTQHGQQQTPHLHHNMHSLTQSHTNLAQMRTPELSMCDSCRTCWTLERQLCWWLSFPPVLPHGYGQNFLSNSNAAHTQQHVTSWHSVKYDQTMGHVSRGKDGAWTLINCQT